MRVAAVIPARLASRRFPRKVLARATGKYLVEHVYERVVGCPGIDRVVIATDSSDVEAAARSFGAEVQRTASEHVSGTDRVAEVAQRLDHDVVINVQGDEPFIAHDDLRLLTALFDAPTAPAAPAAAARRGAPAPTGSGGRRGEVVMTTLAVSRSDEEGFGDPNVVKVVLGEGGFALYFSRASVPYVPAEGMRSGEKFWLQHVGIYAYRREFLLQLATLAPTALEQRERLEQLRVLENGYAIRVGLSEHRHLGIDTEEEYRAFVEEVTQKEL